MNDDALERGERVRREVLGDAHVDAAGAETTVFDAEFQRFITETAWGSVWDRPGLDRRTRSLITIAILAALDRDELERHLRATANTGVTTDEVAEALLHVAIYAGVPAANSAMAAAKRILTDSASSGEEP